MRYAYAAVLIVLLLASCASPSPPPTFTGPVAYLFTTETARGAVAANVAYVSKINGQDSGETIPGQPAPNQPLNPSTGAIDEVEIPAQPSTITLVGHSIFQAPIFGIAMDDYALSGDVSFTPAANKEYIVKGTFTPKYSAVWIEDLKTGAVQGQKVEVNGSALVPVLKKTLVCNPSYCTD